MTFLQLLPALLSWLVFCAHLFRIGMLPLLPFVLPLPLLLFLKHGLVARFFQAALLLIAAQWILVALFTAAHRAEAGQPWLRLVLILAGVALFAFLAAALFESERLQRRYPRRFSF
jgi:hypothetical protein